MKVAFTIAVWLVASVFAHAGDGRAEVPDVRGDAPTQMASAGFLAGATFGRCALVWADGAPEALRSRAASMVSRWFHGAVDEVGLRRGIRSLLDLLADAGYYHAEVGPRDFVLDQGALSFTLAVEPGRPTRIAGWRFAGLSRTDTVWLARALDLPTGVIATGEVLTLAGAHVRGVSYLLSSAPPEMELRPGDTMGVVVLHLRESPAASFDGALAAGGGESTNGATAVAGSLSLGLSGMFRRERSLALRYERLRSDEMMLRLSVAESARFRGRLDWRLELEEWDREDHRQHVQLQSAYRLDRRRDLRAEIIGRWSKTTPGRTAIPPARIIDISVGLAQGSMPRPSVFHLLPFTAWSIHATSSHRREVITGTAANNRTEQRTSLGVQFARVHALGHGLHLRTQSTGHWWLQGRSLLRAGDEWFLGGVEGLRGYAERSLAAASGVSGTMELSGRTGAGIGVCLFVDAAHLKLFDSERLSYLNPYSYGAALQLFGAERVGRLEFAWRDRAAWRDGIVRLTISQGW